MKEPLSSRWYIPWVVATLLMVGLIATAIAAIEVVTATLPAPRSPKPGSAPLERVEDRGHNVESTSMER